MEKSTLVRLGIIGIVIVLIIVIFVAGIPFLNNSHAATTCPQDIGSESRWFTAAVYGTEDSLSFQYIPKDEKPATYSASYEFYEYGSPIISEYNKVYYHIAPKNPIVINVSRQGNATYTMNMSIAKDNEDCPLYQSRVSIAVGIAN